MSDNKVGVGTQIRLRLMTGVSYMIPFVAAGGILIALSFVFGGYLVGEPFEWNWGEGGFLSASWDITSGASWSMFLFSLGKLAFSLMVPVFSGYVAYAIADRPGLVPGFIGGFIAGWTGAGFLGGIVSGFIAGYAALLIGRIPLPNGIKPVMPVVVTPLISVIITGFLMTEVLAAPVKALNEGMTTWLQGLAGAGLVVLGFVLGLMMAFDMGGPVNKVAYFFAVGGLEAVAASTNNEESAFVIMAMVMAAGMTPPLGLALATVVRKNLFSNSERQAGKAAWLLGASFITEGAIPFAAGDPIRVIPSIMIGSGVTGALVGLFHVGSRAPHGGLWVFGLVSNPLLYILAVAIGTVVTAFLVIVAKNIGKNSVTEAALEEENV